MDLFSVSEVVPASGPVPRMLAPGIEWDEAAEARFASLVRDMRETGLMGRGYPLDAAVRSARWAIEADLYRKCIRRAIEASENCRTSEAKREIFAKWVVDYGRVRADEIARLIRSASAKKVVLESW